MSSAGVSNHGIKSRDPIARSSVRELETTTSKLGSNKMLNQILSLYDKKASNRPSEAFANAKVLVPKFNLNTPEGVLDKRPESSIRKQANSGTPPFTNNYLNRVKEILSARKPSYRQSHVDQRRSPKSHKNRWTFFASLKEGDLLKIYDMSSTENLAKQLREKDGLLSRGSMLAPESQLPHSPQDKTNDSVVEQEARSEAGTIAGDHSRPADRRPRQSVASDVASTSLGPGHYHDTRLGDAMNQLLRLVSSRDETILGLRSENRSLKATVASLVTEIDVLKRQLSLYTKL